MKNYVQRGDRLTKTLAGTVSSGDVDVIGTGLLGVACVDGVSGDEIDYAVEGVFTIPKVSAAVIASGDTVYWDVSAGAVDDNAATPAAGDFICGVAWQAGASGDTEIRVKINHAPSAVTSS